MSTIVEQLDRIWSSLKNSRASDYHLALFANLNIVHIIVN
jgi:hypothetical protein